MSFSMFQSIFGQMFSQHPLGWVLLRDGDPAPLDYRGDLCNLNMLMTRSTKVLNLSPCRSALNLLPSFHVFPSFLQTSVLLFHPAFYFQKGEEERFLVIVHVINLPVYVCCVHVSVAKRESGLSLPPTQKTHLSRFLSLQKEEETCSSCCLCFLRNKSQLNSVHVVLNTCTACSYCVQSVWQMQSAF